MTHRPLAMRRKQRVLVYHIGNLGDTVASVPALRVIRRQYGSDAEITLLYDYDRKELISAQDVLTGSGLIDHFLGYRKARGWVQISLAALDAWWRILLRRFDTVIYLMQSERSARSVARDKLFFRACGIQRRLGFEAFSKEYLYPGSTDGRLQVVDHEALRRLNRLRKEGFDQFTEEELNEPFLRLPDSETEKAVNWLSANRQFPERVLVGFCPGSKMPAKVWPTERFVEIGKRLLATGAFEIVIAGGPAEMELGNRLTKEWGSGLNAAGSFSVLGSAAVLQQCRFAFVTDSGPMHLAAAVGTPCVALFSCVDYPGRFHPLGRGHVLLRHDVPCAGCRMQVCPIQGHPCMTGITVEESWEAIEQICGRLVLPLSKEKVCQ